MTSQEDDDAEVPDLLTPSLVGSLKALNKKIAQISPTNASYWLNLDLGHSHTFAVLESGNLYAFGGVRGQLGVKLADGRESERPKARSYRFALIPFHYQEA
jgi:hypothetical protein